MKATTTCHKLSCITKISCKIMNYVLQSCVINGPMYIIRTRHKMPNITRTRYK